MKKKFEHKESKGLPGGPNEMFTYVTSVFDIYQAPSNIEGEGMFAGKPFKKGDLIGLAHSNGQPTSQLGRMHNHDENSPTMISKKSGNDRFVFAAKDLQPGDELTTNYRMQPELEQPEDFQYGGSVMAPPRKGVRKNSDGSESTHLMATETLDGKNWFSFPTLFQDPDGTWIDMSNKPWQEAYEEAKKRGEVIDFGTDKEAAIKFGEGSWKLPSYQDKGEVVLDPRRTIEQDNTRVKQVIVPQEFRQPSRPAQPQATISQYNPPSTFEYLLNKAANPMTTLGYAVRGQDIPDRVSDKDNVYDMAADIINPAAWLDYGIKAVDDLSEGDFVGAGLNTLGAIPAVPATVANAKNVTKVVNKIPGRVNPRYFKPNEDLWYRQVGKSAIDDIAESKVIRERGEDILKSQEIYDDRVLRMQGIDPSTGKPFDNYQTAFEQRILAARRPKSPYFQKGELYWGWNRKPGKGKPGRGGDADSEYLIESMLADDAFHPAHVKGMYPDNPDKWVGDIGILKPRPEFRDPANFNLYQRNWWSGYKPVKQNGGQLPKAQEGNGEVPLNRGEIFNIPRTVRYENGKMVLQDKPIWDGMLDEVTITPTTASEYAWQENRANQSTGGLEPVYPIFDLMSSGLRAPLTKGAKAVQGALTSENTLRALARSPYVPKVTKPGLIKNYKSKFPNVDLRGTGTGNYSKLGVNELGLGVDDFGPLTNYERSAISQVNQTQPADEVFNTFVQRYADFNTDDALSNQLADFSRRNPRTKFEINLGRDVTPSKRMQEIFDDPELNVHNVFSHKSSGPMNPINEWGNEGRLFYDSSARNAAGEFEKNLRSYGEQGFYAANVPMGKPVKQALTYNKDGRVFDYVTETLPVSDFVVNKGLMNPDVIGNFSRYRGAGDMANQHNFLLGITNSPSVIVSGNKGFAGLKGGNKLREKIGGLITPEGGKAVPSYNNQVVPLLKQEFNLSKPFEGTFIKSPSVLETYYNSAGQASPYTNFPGILDIDDLFTTGKSNLAKGGQLPKAQDGNGEAPLSRDEIFNIPRTMGYENGKMVLQDKPIWDGMLDEVTVTPYTQSHILSDYMMNNKATGGLQPVYPIFDIMTLGLKAPATAGVKAIQAGIKNAPLKKTVDIGNKYVSPFSYKRLYQFNPLANQRPPFTTVARTQMPGQTGKLVMGQYYDDLANQGKKLNWRQNLDRNSSRRFGWGRGFSSDPNDIMNYSHPSFTAYRGYDSNVINPELLIQRFPTSYLDEFMVGNLSSNAQKAYGSGKRFEEFILPIDDVLSAKSKPLSREAYNEIKNIRNAENTPHWWKGFQEVKALGGSLPKAQKGNGEIHTVASGETFFGIANKYKLDKQDLIDANPGLNIESIKAGQTINLPVIEKMEAVNISAADSKREPTSWTDYINPYNWGVTDRDDDGTFNQAFRAARNASEDEFMWYGTRYNTNLKPTPDKLEVEEVSNEVEAVKETGPFENYSVTPELLYKQAFVESTLDPKAKNDLGYMGLGQIGDKLIADYKKANKIDAVDPYDAKQNHDVQDWSMNELYNATFIDKPGSTNENRLLKALASYNWGRGKVKDLLEEQKAKGVDIYTDTSWTSELPKETREYIDMILYDGATEKRPLVQENFKNALVDSTYKDIRDLYIYKSGGEKNQFQIYKDYVEGVYDGTEMEKAAEKIYDKLNRVYYKEAKKQGMRVPNYIMTNVIKQIDN